MKNNLVKLFTCDKKAFYITVVEQSHIFQLLIEYVYRPPLSRPTSDINFPPVINYGHVLVP